MHRAWRNRGIFKKGRIIHSNACVKIQERGRKKKEGGKKG